MLPGVMVTIVQGTPNHSDQSIGPEGKLLGPATASQPNNINSSLFNITAALKSRKNAYPSKNGSNMN